MASKSMSSFWIVLQTKMFSIFCSSNTSNEIYLRMNLFPHFPTTSPLFSTPFPISVNKQHCHLPKVSKTEAYESRPFSLLSAYSLLFLPFK